MEMPKTRKKRHDCERDDVRIVNNSTQSQRKMKQKKKKTVAQGASRSSWVLLNVPINASVGYYANFRDMAVTFHNSVTRSCTSPKVTKSSSMQWRILSHAAFGKRKRMFDSANLASSQI